MSNNIPTLAEIFANLCPVIAHTIHDSDPNGTWILESTPLVGGAPHDSCGFARNGLGGLAGAINSTFPIKPPLTGADLVGCSNVGAVAQLICDRYAS
jgi:hypothetical protein